MGIQYFNECPAYAEAVWEGVRVMNPDVVKWSGNGPPPAIGSTIKYRGREWGVVVRYFVEGNWLGVAARPDGCSFASVLDHVFGTEVRCS
jgi:hypothetical protein